MLDAFDLHLLNLVQRDDARTSESLARDIPLSPSAISRRLRRLREQGWIARTIALLGSRLTQNRLRAIVLVRFHDIPGRWEVERRLQNEPMITFCFEIAGPYDTAAFFDCANMAEFNELADQILTSTTVDRYETHFVKRELKFAPFVELLPH